MTSYRPKVSIGMPVYNGERFIEEAIDSILAQTFEDFTLVISDNTSTDGTEEICRGYVRKDDRVQYTRNRANYGYVYNFNNAFRLSQGEYFKWAAYDDILGPGFLTECVKVLDADPSVVLAYGATEGIDEQGREAALNFEISDQNSSGSTFSTDPTVRFGRLLEHLWGTAGPFAGLIRSEALSRTNLHGFFTGGDHVLLAHLSLLGRFYENPDPHFFLRVHPQRGSAMSNPKQRVAYSETDQISKVRFDWWKVARAYPRRIQGYTSAVHHSPLSRPEKARCYAAVAGAASRWVRRPGRGGY